MTVKGGRWIQRRVEITSTLENHLKIDLWVVFAEKTSPTYWLFMTIFWVFNRSPFVTLIIETFRFWEVRLIMTGTAHINRWWQMNRSRFDRLMGRDKFLRLPMCQSVKRFFCGREKLCNLRFVKNISFNMSAGSSIVFFGRLGQVPAPLTMIILLRLGSAVGGGSAYK